jgi:hypothetical protein
LGWVGGEPRLNNCDTTIEDGDHVGLRL